MMTFYAAAGSYQIRNEDGKDMPYIMRLGKLQPVSIPEFSIWSMLLWDVLTHDELRKKYFEKMEEVKLDPSGFEKALEMLVKRKLIIKGVGYTGADALYNMLYDTYVIPLRGVQGTRRLLNIAKLLKQGKGSTAQIAYRESHSKFVCRAASIIPSVRLAGRINSGCQAGPVSQDQVRQSEQHIQFSGLLPQAPVPCLSVSEPTLDHRKYVFHFSANR